MSNLLPKGQRRRVRRGRGKAPPSHLLQPPPPQLAPSFVQSHTKDKGPRPAWPSAPSSLKALKETAPPPCPGAVGRDGPGAPQDLVSAVPHVPPTFPSLPQPQVGNHSPPGQGHRGATWPRTGGVGGERKEAARDQPLPSCLRQRGQGSSVVQHQD